MKTVASNWEREYNGTLEDAGFAVGRATSFAFCHPVRIVMYGDEFVVEGEIGEVFPRTLWVVQKIKQGQQGDEQDCMTVIVDSDWAGCSLTRKGTHGGCLMWRGVCMKVWSTMQ